jgi:hypothetical protein
MAAVAAPAAAFGAANNTITVRVEGKTRTLVPATLVHVHSGSVTKGKAPKGACPALSAAGALDQATHHRWSGTYYSSFSGYLIEAILGEKYGASAKYYWEFFVDNVSASMGACITKPHPGEQIMFAAVPVADAGDYPLVITGVPRSVRAGHAFAVKVAYVDATGKKRALSGARVSGSDFAAATTTAAGTVTITPLKSGKLTLVAQHGAIKRAGHSYGYVRSPSVSLHVGA